MTACTSPDLVIPGSQGVIPDLIRDPVRGTDWAAAQGRNDGVVAWKLAAFDDLSVHELYQVLQLRTEVFAVEQNCAFQDMDGADAQAVHLMGTRDGQLVAYARCFPAGVKFVEASIGRVVTRRLARGSGLGHLLMQRCVTAVRELWGAQAIRIGAQAHLERFYNSHGFVDVGMPYMEDGISHIEMLRPV